MITIFNGLSTDVVSGLTTLFAGAFGVLVVALLALDLLPWIVRTFRRIFGTAA